MDAVGDAWVAVWLASVNEEFKPCALWDCAFDERDTAGVATLAWEEAVLIKRSRGHGGERDKFSQLMDEQSN